MPLARITPHSKHNGTAVSTNVSEATRRDAQRVVLADTEKQLRNIEQRKSEIEREFSEIKFWRTAEIAKLRPYPDDAARHVEIVAKSQQQKLPLRNELAELERQRKELRKRRHKYSESDHNDTIGILKSILDVLKEIRDHMVP